MARTSLSITATDRDRRLSAHFHFGYETGAARRPFSLQRPGATREGVTDPAKLVLQGCTRIRARPAARSSNKVYAIYRVLFFWAQPAYTARDLALSDMTRGLGPSPQPLSRRERGLFRAGSRRHTGMSVSDGAGSRAKYCCPLPGGARGAVCGGRTSHGRLLASKRGSESRAPVTHDCTPFTTRQPAHESGVPAPTFPAKPRRGGTRPRRPGRGPRIWRGRGRGRRRGTGVPWPP